MGFVKKILKEYGFYFLFLIIGLLVFFYPMLGTKFDLMPGMGEYSKYFNYILEHSWLWLNQNAPNYYFWSPPFSYPQESTLASSDSLVGIMPIYWGLRLFRLNPFTSFQILMMLLCILNYATFYYLLNHRFKFSNFASSISSFIFAFSVMRYFRMDEIGYFTQFYTILAIIFLLNVNENNSRIKNHFWFLLFAISIILQFYSCYTLGFFSLFIGFLGLLLALLPKSGRVCVINYFKKYYKFLLFYFLVIFLMLIPLSYNIVNLGVMKTYRELVENISNFTVWIRNVSVFDNLFFKNLYYVSYFRSKEFSIGTGIFTLIFSLIGMWKIKYSKGIPILLLIFIFMISSGSCAIFIWKILYFLLFGSEIISSPVRSSFIALIIISFGIAFFIQYMQNLNSKNKVVNVLFIAAIFIIMLEQIPFTKDKNSAWENFSYSKKDFISEIKNESKKINKNCKIIEFEYEAYNYEQFGKRDFFIKKTRMKKQQNLLAMWLSLENNIRTTNSFLKLGKTEKEIILKNKCHIKSAFDLSKI